MADACIQVFAKAPTPGEVKTRLIPALGAAGAAELHRRLSERQLQALSTVSASGELWCAPDCADPFFRHCCEQYGVTLHAQRGDDLGERLYRGLADGLRRHRFAIAVGCDIPGLDAVVIEEALKMLEQGSETVFVPAEDGGYGLIGLTRIDRKLFEGIAWGSASVMEESRERLRTLGWRWHELNGCWDLDRPEDLERLSRLDGSLLQGL